MLPAGDGTYRAANTCGTSRPRARVGASITATPLESAHHQIARAVAAAAPHVSRLMLCAQPASSTAARSAPPRPSAAPAPAAASAPPAPDGMKTTDVFPCPPTCTRTCISRQGQAHAHITSAAGPTAAGMSAQLRNRLTSLSTSKYWGSGSSRAGWMHGHAGMLLAGHACIPGRCMCATFAVCERVLHRLAHLGHQHQLEHVSRRNAGHC